METVKIKDIYINNYKLSPTNYLKNKIVNTNLIEVGKYIDKIDKGSEIGSQNYVEESNYLFLRTSAFDENYFSPKIDNNSLLKVIPYNYNEKNLKKGDILICKDSNVGEVVIRRPHLQAPALRCLP